MQEIKLHWSAPVDFDLDLWAEFIPWIVADTKEANVWVVNPNGRYVSEDELNHFPKLEVLATPSTGSNHVDLEELKRRGIKFLSLLDDRDELYGISASSEWTFKLILDGLRLKVPKLELQGKKVGIVGYGRIGMNIDRYCSAFRIKRLMIYDPYVADFYETKLMDVFKQCDVVVVCCTLNDETKHMIGKDQISCMKHNAVLVNTARGDVINEAEMIEVMKERRDLRFALDVVQGETDGTANRAILRHLGALVTNHVAGETFDSRTKAARIIYRLLANLVV